MQLLSLKTVQNLTKIANLLRILIYHVTKKFVAKYFVTNNFSAKFFSKKLTYCRQKISLKESPETMKFHLMSVLDE